MTTAGATVLMPVYNEPQDRLGLLVQEILAEGYALIIVDDGSDEMVSIKSPQLTVLRHKLNLGQGAALETGLEFARLKGHDILVLMDADGQHRVKEIAQLIQPIMEGKADIVFGSRFLSTSSASLIPISRRWMLRISRIANVLFTGLWMSDVHNGFRAMNKKAIRGIHLQIPGRGHASEIIYRTRQLNLNYCEMPVNVDYHLPHQHTPLGTGRLFLLACSLLIARLRRYNIRISSRTHLVRTQCLHTAGIQD